MQGTCTLVRAQLAISNQTTEYCSLVKAPSALDQSQSVGHLLTLARCQPRERTWTRTPSPPSDSNRTTAPRSTAHWLQWPSQLVCHKHALQMCARDLPSVATLWFDGY